MGCPPLRGNNPRAFSEPRVLACGLSYVQVGKHGITIFTTYISVDHAHHAIFRAKVCKDEYITHSNLGNFAYLLYLAEFFFFKHNCFRNII